MKLVVLGDIHDRVRNLDKALEAVNAHAPDAMICTGDLVNTNTLIRLADGFPNEIHLALGNNDSESDIKRTIDTDRLLAVYYHGLHGRLTLDKRHVAFTHKPKDAELLLAENRFDIVFYGHTHEARVEQKQQTDHEYAIDERRKTWLVNPGDIQGRFGRTPSFVLYDTATGIPTLHEID